MLIQQSVQRLRVIVTGASRGIGRAIAAECARRGAVVGANYCRSKDEAASLRAAFPENVRLLHFDVRDFDAVHAAFEAFAEAEGGIDALVNNAGIGARPQFLIKAGRYVIDDIIHTNLIGVLYCTRAALQHMTKARRGHVLNVGSVAAVCPMEGVTAYAASKGAIESLAAAVAKEYARRNVRAHCLRFGLVRTDMTRGLIAAAAAAANGAASSEFGVHEPEEVARVAADLLFGVTRADNGAVVTLPGPSRDALHVNVPA